MRKQTPPPVIEEVFRLGTVRKVHFCLRCGRIVEHGRAWIAGNFRTRRQAWVICVTCQPVAK